MSRAKGALLSLMAVCALGAFAASTASAAGTHQFIINGTILTSSEEVQGNNLPDAAENQFEVVIAKLSIHIYCQTALILSGTNNVIEGGAIGKVKTKAEFKGCTVFQVSKAGASEALPECKVKEPITTTQVEGELTAAGELQLKPKEKVFSEITLEKTNKEATCVAESKSNVEGGILVCAVPHFGVDAYIGVLTCAPGGSSLTFGKEPAKLYLTTGLSLEKGGKWHLT